MNQLRQGVKEASAKTKNQVAGAYMPPFGMYAIMAIVDFRLPIGARATERPARRRHGKTMSPPAAKCERSQLI